MINTEIKRLFDILRFGLLILLYTGPRVALQKLAHQIYGKTIFLGLVTQLDKIDASSPSTELCIAAPALSHDVEEFFKNIRAESIEGRYQLLVRKWYHKRGLGKCYITRTSDTNEMCNIRWIVTAKDMIEAGFVGRLPELKEDEANMENVYTLERYRNRGIQTASALQVRQIVKEFGFNRTVGQVAEDNIASLRSNKKRGGQVFQRVLERHLLFRVKRKVIERYEPPIPITIPLKD